jgi:hypothetical protein
MLKIVSGYLYNSLLKKFFFLFKSKKIHLTRQENITLKELMQCFQIRDQNVSLLTSFYYFTKFLIKSSNGI